MIDKFSIRPVRFSPIGVLRTKPDRSTRVDTIQPDYPLLVVGLNESMDISDYFNTLGKSTEITSSGYYPYITKIKLKKHPKYYKP